jgi:hypothetical protein
MNARRLLERMCSRHGLPAAEAERLVPLVARALASRPDVRDRILTLVEDNLARKAGGDTDAGPERVLRDLDAEVLSSVARVLHGWTPSSTTLGLASLPEGFLDGLDLGGLSHE